MEEIPNNHLGCIVHPVNKGIFTISTVFQCIFTISMIYYVVVSNIFYFHPYLGQILILIDIFLMGWNHQPVWVESLGHIFTSAMRQKVASRQASRWAWKEIHVPPVQLEVLDDSPKSLRKKRWHKTHHTTFWKCLVKMFGIFIFFNFVVLKVNMGYRFKSLSCVSSLSTKEIDLHGWNVEWVEITAEITTQLILTFNFRISSFRFISSLFLFQFSIVDFWIGGKKSEGKKISLWFLQMAAICLEEKWTYTPPKCNSSPLQKDAKRRRR